MRLSSDFRVVAATALAVSVQAATFPSFAGGGGGAENAIAHRKADLSGEKADFELYLDRLMMAESGGRDLLKNPRSSALGPYQFIKGTFLWVVRRHFAERVAGLGEAEILALRTDRAFSRMVIAEYTRELAQHLDRHGLPTTYGNLRLAYLLGPSGATRVLSADPAAPVREFISVEALSANPFLTHMTAQDIIARAHRDISIDRSKRLTVTRRPDSRDPGELGIKVNCNLARASCRRWLALKKKRVRREAAGRSGGGEQNAAAR